MHGCQTRLPKPKSPNRSFWVHSWKPGHLLCAGLCTAAFCFGISSTVSFWGSTGLSRKNNNKPNEPSKESLDFFLQKTLWLFLEFACQLPSVSEMNSFLLLPRDIPNLPVTWLKLTASTLQGNSASSRKSWRWARREVLQLLASSKNTVQFSLHKKCCRFHLIRKWFGVFLCEKHAFTYFVYFMHFSLGSNLIAPQIVVVSCHWTLNYSFLHTLEN